MINDTTMSVYESVRDDIFGLHIRWQIYKELFTDSDNVDNLLLGKIKVVFGVFENLLFDDGILTLHRLIIDKAKTSGKENSNLDQLISMLSSDPNYSNLADSLRQKLDALRKKCENIGLYRHKAIGHSDLNLALLKASSAHPERNVMTTPFTLKDVPIGDIDNTLQLLEKFMNEIENSLSLYQSISI